VRVAASNYSFIKHQQMSLIITFIGLPFPRTLKTFKECEDDSNFHFPTFYTLHGNDILVPFLLNGLLEKERIHKTLSLRACWDLLRKSLPSSLAQVQFAVVVVSAGGCTIIAFMLIFLCFFSFFLLQDLIPLIEFS